MSADVRVLRRRRRRLSTIRRQHHTGAVVHDRSVIGVEAVQVKLVTAIAVVFHLRLNRRVVVKQRKHSFHRKNRRSAADDQTRHASQHAERDRR